MVGQGGHVAKRDRNRPAKIPKIFVRPHPVTISQAMKVTKWSTYSGETNVSEHQSEPAGGETGAVGAGPVVSTSTDAPGQPKAASDVESPALGSGQDADAPKIDAAKADAPKADAPEADAPRTPGKVMIMSAGERSWDHKGVEPETEQAQDAPG